MTQHKYLQCEPKLPPQQAHLPLEHLRVMRLTLQGLRRLQVDRPT